MRRIALPLLLLASLAWGASFRMWLTDGTYQLVNEYEVKKDRVRYLSAERGEWEEIPIELVDLKKTKDENAENEARVLREAKEQEEEDKAIEAEKKQIFEIPEAVGAYYIRGEKLDAIKGAEVKIVKDKKRTALKILSPIPLVPGKSTVELDGEKAPFVVTEDRPEFYFRIPEVLSIAMVKLDVKKGLRVVETVSVAPVTNELAEDRKVVATFKKQIDEFLFKIWPEQPLAPGEYALIQYNEGEMNPQVWDFHVGK